MNRFISKQLLPLALEIGAILLVGILLFAIAFKDIDADSYEEYLTEVTSIGSTSSLRLSSDNIDDVSELGLDPDLVAYHIAAASWVNQRGGDIDLGMLLATVKGESSGNTYVGDWDGLNMACTYFEDPGMRHRECLAAKWLLDRWEKTNARDLSEFVADRVNEDYSDYVGHNPSGVMGPNGILPTTGLKICSVLREHEDSLIASCAFHDPMVGAFAAAVWLDMIEYGSSESDEHNFQKLYEGWNRDAPYVVSLMNMASQINQKHPDMENWAVYENVSADFLSEALIAYLDLFGLLPDGFGSSAILIEGDIAYPLSAEGMPDCGFKYGAIVANGIHRGTDMCYAGWATGPVYAAHGGKVELAETVNSAEWWCSGETVVVSGTTEDGKDLWSRYCHGEVGSFEVEEGDEVQAGDLLMQVGNTGWGCNSNGCGQGMGPNHLDFGVKIDDEWVNPLDFLATVLPK